MGGRGREEAFSPARPSSRCETIKAITGAEVPARYKHLDELNSG
jgi:hypothetical protein